MLARKAERSVEIAEGSAREVGHPHADQEGSLAPDQRSHSHSPRPAVSSQSRQQDPLRLAPWPPVLVDQGAWVGVNGDGRWRATHGRTPRSEANPASRTRMWRPTVFSRQLAPLNTATVPPVCDRASDPYQKLSVGVWVRQAPAQQANRPTFSARRMPGVAWEAARTRQVERRTAAGAPATRAESSSRTSAAPERRGAHPHASPGVHTPSGSSSARRHHYLRPGNHDPTRSTSRWVSCDNSPPGPTISSSDRLPPTALNHLVRELAANLIRHTLKDPRRGRRERNDSHSQSDDLLKMKA